MARRKGESGNGGDPLWTRVAASTAPRALVRAGVGQGHSTEEAGNAGGGKGPDFWCAFDAGEDW
jgi:hypothetical protein